MGTLGFVLGTRAMDHELVMIDQLRIFLVCIRQI